MGSYTHTYTCRNFSHPQPADSTPRVLTFPVSVSAQLLSMSISGKSSITQSCDSLDWALADHLWNLQGGLLQTCTLKENAVWVNVHTFRSGRFAANLHTDNKCRYVLLDKTVASYLQWYRRLTKILYSPSLQFKVSASDLHKQFRQLLKSTQTIQTSSKIYINNSCSF